MFAYPWRYAYLKLNTTNLEDTVFFKFHYKQIYSNLQFNIPEDGTVK